MDEYRSVHNLSLIANACHKMLTEKFQIVITSEKLQLLIDDISQQIHNEYINMNLNTKELNNITLSKIKKIYEVQSTNTTKVKDDLLDDDMLQSRLQFLENQRKLVSQSGNVRAASSVSPNITVMPASQINFSQAAPAPALVLPSILNTQNIQNTQHTQHTQNIHKTLIINSINRDWHKRPQRNNMQFTMPIDPYLHQCYIRCVCFPEYVKQITPYILMNISDGGKNKFITLIPEFCNDCWDIWKPIEESEYLGIQTKQCSVKFFDLSNAELDLGSDNISIKEVSYNNNKFVLKLDNAEGNLRQNSAILVKTGNGKIHNKRIVQYQHQNNLLTILDDQKDLAIDDFIDSKILNISSQYAIIMSYTSLNK